MKFILCKSKWFGKFRDFPQYLGGHSAQPTCIVYCNIDDLIIFQMLTGPVNHYRPICTQFIYLPETGCLDIIPQLHEQDI